MKLTSFRLSDEMHLKDLDEAGAITPEIEAGLPPALAEKTGAGPRAAVAPLATAYPSEHSADATYCEILHLTSSMRLVRRASAALLLVVFSLALIVPALAASDPQSNLPPCCRRGGKHHCAMMESLRESSPGPRWQVSRCPLYPGAQAVPGNRTVSTPGKSPILSTALISYPVIRPQSQSLSRHSFSRGWRKRGPPVSL